MCTKKAECQIKYGGQNNRNAQCLRGIASMFSTILHFTVNVQRHRPMQIQELVRPACSEAEIKGVVFSVHKGDQSSSPDSINLFYSREWNISANESLKWRSVKRKQSVILCKARSPSLRESFRKPKHMNYFLVQRLLNNDDKNSSYKQQALCFVFNALSKRQQQKMQNALFPKFSQLFPRRNESHSSHKFLPRNDKKTRSLQLFYS